MGVEFYPKCSYIYKQRVFKWDKVPSKSSGASTSMSVKLTRGSRAGVQMRKRNAFNAFSKQEREWDQLTQN